jgi:predicted nucleotidyltransferase component of viral defense system
MDKRLRETQLEILRVFGGAAKTFALAGGTALELFYLKHRFSRDLDFFSPRYPLKEIDDLVAKFSRAIGEAVKLESEFTAAGRARVRFYSVRAKSGPQPLKIDFVEDVFLGEPDIKRFHGVPVYSAHNIYFQKIIALTGTSLTSDEIGRPRTSGRREARDVVDLYYLSQKVEPLHAFMAGLERPYQRGLVEWYRSYSRQETRLGALDLEIYDPDFDVSAMIRYLDAEIKRFMGGVIK